MGDADYFDILSKNESDQSSGGCLQGTGFRTLRDPSVHEMREPSPLGQLIGHLIHVSQRRDACLRPEDV
jgi:hypothetical protein